MKMPFPSPILATINELCLPSRTIICLCGEIIWRLTKERYCAIIITCSGYFTYTEPNFRNPNLSKLEDIYKLKLTILLKATYTKFFIYFV